MTEHVGRVSDSLTMDSDEEAFRKSSAARMAKVMQPSGKVFKAGTHRDLGNGERCPTVDEEGNNLGHGKMYHMESGRDYCPHQSHDMGIPRTGVYHGPIRKQQEVHFDG